MPPIATFVLTEFYNKIRELRSSGLRYGQSVFNTLTEIDPKYAESIRGTEKDPYYMDDNNTERFVIEYLTSF